MAFSFAFIESLAIIGSLIPGIILMSYVGYLMGTEAIPLAPGLITVMMGAFLGDYLSYLIGKFYRPFIIQTKIYKNNITKWTYGENILKKNGIIGMTLGRIIGPVRSTIPLIAGLINMPQKIFFMGATGSVLIWTLCYLSPSILITSFGSDLDMNLSKQMLSTLIEGFFHMALIGTMIKYYLSFHKKKNIAGQSTILCAALTYITLLLYTNSNVLVLNDITLSLTQKYHTQLGLLASSFLSISADKYTLYGFCFLATFILVIRKQFKQAILFATATFGVGFAIKFIKVVINYPRPDLMIHLLGPTAFPSGHTGLYATTAFVICHLLSEHHPEKKSIFWQIGILSTVFVMAARLYLGAHWLTDVIGGLIIGHLFYLVPYHWLAKKVDSAPVLKQTTHQLSILFVLALLLIPVLRLNISSLTYHYDPKLYEIKNLQHVYNSEAIKKKTPASIQYAQNTLGISQYPLNIQAQTPLSEWTNLMKNNWTVDEDVTFSNLTVLGHPPSIVLKHHSVPDQFMVLWSYHHLIEHDQPFVIGLILKKNKKIIQVIDAKPYLENISFDIEHHSQKNIYTQLQGWNGNIYKMRKETI
jgi:membrane protein DedA with SNARE-associated domain/membrane-associated phospholipid phosphatase